MKNYSDLFYDLVQKELGGKIPSYISYDLYLREINYDLFMDYIDKKYNLSNLLFFKKDNYCTIDDRSTIEESYYYKINNLLYLCISISNDNNEKIKINKLYALSNTQNIDVLIRFEDYIKNYDEFSYLRKTKIDKIDKIK